MVQKGDAVTAAHIAHHIRDRAGEYQGSNHNLLHSLANEVDKYGSTSANDLIKKHKDIAKKVGMEPSAAHNFITSVVRNNI